MDENLQEPPEGGQDNAMALPEDRYTPLSEHREALGWALDPNALQGDLGASGEEGEG